MDSFVDDPYELPENYMGSKCKRTGVNENFQLTHQCDWDIRHPESPKRLSFPLKRLEDLKLLKECKKFSSKRDGIENFIESVHNKSLISNLKKFCSVNITSREEIASNYDSVYIHESTYDAAIEAASSVVNLAEAICTNQIKNGFALVRPPGHHAMENEYNGYCFFNNVAIAANFCLNKELANKILIIDFDVHHGQGTQRKFYDSNKVLYFSVHRYQHGTFWPNLRESNFDYIGKSDGTGYNINVPLNETGLTDSDYLAIVFYVLLPVAYEYNPDLIIISAGYDCCVGCPEGEMLVTPGFYAHLVTLLSSLANGHTLVVLEGGYNLDSLTEGISMTLSALLNYTCPKLAPITHIKPSVIETINNVRRTLYSLWNCFELVQLNEHEDGEHKCVIQYYGEPLEKPFPTRQCYPTLKYEEKLYFEKYINALRELYHYKPFKACYFYNVLMLLHAPVKLNAPPEVPERLDATFEKLTQSSVFPSITHVIMSCVCNPQNCCAFNPHVQEYIDKVENLDITERNDLYFNEDTYISINAAIHGLLTLIDQIMDSGREPNSGIALIRPPGHHAEPDTGMGFCFFNNIAFAANYLKQKYNIKRILILDFDVHHGNGTQKFFYDSSEVMYISVHRYDDGNFFPHQKTADYEFHGNKCGEGFNMNIPFSNGNMGDSEYMSVFFNIILPAAYSYCPDVILVSAGFDAGINDPLGRYKVSPQTFGHFITLLKPLANGRIVLCLEGGYNKTTLSYSVVMCCKALIAQPIPPINNLYKNCIKSAYKTINHVMDHFKKYWPVFGINQKLSKFMYERKVDDRNPYRSIDVKINNA